MKRFPVVILAGGLATRLRPMTEKIPKALAEVGGRPFIEHQLELLRSHGFQRVIISAWYKGEMIRECVGDGARFGMEVSYVFDGDAPLGTGGAVRKALPLLSGAFFVLYGDSYLPCDYGGIQEYFEGQARPALMTVYRNRGQWDTSNVEMGEGRIVAYDKKARTAGMDCIDYGLGVFRPEIFAVLPEGEPMDLARIYQDLVREDRLAAYEVQERFYEIGSLEGLRELDGLLAGEPQKFLRKEIP